MIKDWNGHSLLEEHTNEHCGTTIVLSPRNKVNSEQQIRDLVAKAEISGFYVDPTYPVDVELTVEALTVGYILVKNKEEVLKNFPELTIDWELYK